MPELPEVENIARALHFGMSGVVRVEPDSAPRRKHEHLVIKLSGWGKGRLANKREK